MASIPSATANKLNFARVIANPTVRHALIIALRKALAGKPSQPSTDLCFAPS